jgi:hypothetical protein
VKARIIWADPVLELLLSLPERDRERILSRVGMLAHFPYMYPVRIRSRRFRRHRWFCVGDWIVYYRVVEKTAFIRGLWPVRIPQDCVGTWAVSR